ncbi:hypothetical protein GCM10027185_59550 [Spirosoma pulveris]
MPARQCFQFSEGGLNACQSVGGVGAELRTLLGIYCPIEGIFGDVDTDEVAKVYVVV